MNRLLLLLLLVATPLSAERVTLLHFSDYHSHAIPFYSEGKMRQGGIARAVGYLRDEKRRPNTFVFSGGDMVNMGAPAWSDKYRCVEWPWLNGIVDAMAYGNHDADYGAAEFERCRASLRYPIIGANVVDGEGRRLLDVDGKPYLVLRTRKGLRLGVFAVAGADFDRLVPPAMRPSPAARFDDRVRIARETVRALREIERVHAVIVIGHAHREEDEQLARSVPGIDVIFGSHSHIKAEPVRIEGTDSWYVSPFQYLAYVSRIEIDLEQAGVRSVRGKLVRIGHPMREDSTIAKRVAAMQRKLERDPAYAALFRAIGFAPKALSIDDSLQAQTPLGVFVMEVVRKAADADLALSTSSSFRQAIAPGRVTVEDLRATLPYPNAVLVYSLTGREVRELLAIVERKKGSDGYAQLAGKLEIDDDREYRVATTDYLATRAAGYREFFANRKPAATGLEVRATVQAHIECEWINRP